MLMRPGRGVVLNFKNVSEDDGPQWNEWNEMLGVDAGIRLAVGADGLDDISDHGGGEPGIDADEDGFLHNAVGAW